MLALGKKWLEFTIFAAKRITLWMTHSRFGQMNTKTEILFIKE